MSSEKNEQLAEQQNDAELFRFIVESAEDYAIFMMSLDRRVVSWNVGAHRLTGWSESEAIGKSADIIFTPEDRKAGAPEREASVALADKRAQDLRWHLRKDGSRFWGDGILQRLEDDKGRLLGLVKILRDRTAERNAEEARKKADRRKDEFLAILAHELRNPLAAIRNAAQVSQLPQTDAETLRWSHEVISRQVSSLSHMINDLMDVSRINRGKIHLKRELVDIAPVLDRTVEAVAHEISAKNHELSVDIAKDALQVYGDTTRLEQIFTNLLTNAAKYTDRGGRIKVSAYLEEDTVVVSCKDNGIGLGPEALSEIFEIFSQVDKALDRARGGLGIGLSVVKKLVEMHGGSIWAFSEGLGQGSEFTVRLPAFRERSDEAAAGGSSSEQPEMPQPTRILVVDDNVDTATGMVKLLALAGHDVKAAHTGESALEVALDFAPQVVLLDIGLPVLDGYQVATRMRQHEQLRGALIIAISGYCQEQDRALSREAGFDHHLAKPIAFETLLELIAQWEAPKPQEPSS